MSISEQASSGESDGLITAQAEVLQSPVMHASSKKVPSIFVLAV